MKVIDISTNKKPNRLIAEKSPYLLQHAFNPVDWYPWGEEAFNKAKQENKPVFVSIGYSTCHWCHVMERESFENEEVAKLLNERFVSIKVDREERPDIDSIYMLVCQMMTGHGGWPMSVFLTPEKVPFYAGTYFPKESRYGMPGFKEVITYLSDQYNKEPEKISSVVEQVTEALHTARGIQESGQVTVEAAENAFRHYKQTFDSVYGGFGEAPKFPIPHSLSFLLLFHKFYNNENALMMVEKTLDGLARGGIYDHIGFGFARYSVDEKYLVPHFEKMLYDNALLAMAYTDAYSITQKDIYKKVAEEIFTYVLRDMQHSEGAFYSAEDADSEGEEGKFYVWTPDEVEQVVGKELGGLFCKVYDITEDGNFEGHNIPNLINESVETYAKRRDIELAYIQNKLEEARQSLFKHRERRIRPFRDDKILTAWNGLMIASLAKAGRVFNQPIYLQEARRALTFIENNLIVQNRLMVRFRDGEVKHKAFIDDYAFLLWGYIELYQSTFDHSILEKAKILADQLIELFWDSNAGGFYFNGDDQEELLIRQKESYDGALPSGNSAALLNLIRLAKITGDFSYEEKVEKTLSAFGKEINEYPTGHTLMLQSVLLTRNKMKEVVVLLNEEESNEELTELIQKLQQGFYPEITLLAGKKEELERVAAYTKDYMLQNEKSTIFVCENFQCNQPTNDIVTALRYLNT